MTFYITFADLHTFTFEHSITSGRPALTDEMAKTVAASLIHTHIDYANSLIHGSINIKILERVHELEAVTAASGSNGCDCCIADRLRQLSCVGEGVYSDATQLN